MVEVAGVFQSLLPSHPGQLVQIAEPDAFQGLLYLGQVLAGHRQVDGVGLQIQDGAGHPEASHDVSHVGHRHVLRGHHYVVDRPPAGVVQEPLSVHPVDDRGSLEGEFLLGPAALAVRGASGHDAQSLGGRVDAPHADHAVH